MAPPVQYNSILEDQFHGKPNYRRVDAVAGASSFVSVLNLVNNIVGAGLFSMPWVLQQASILVGCLLLGMMAILNGISFILLVRLPPTHLNIYTGNVVGTPQLTTTTATPRCL